MLVQKMIKSNSLINILKSTFILILFSTSVYAEPYLAVKVGQKCAACHLTPTGGGMRNDFGQAYGRSLAIESSKLSKLSGKLSPSFRLGGDFRVSLRVTDGDDRESQNQFQTDRMSVYLDAQLIPDTLSFYIDQQFSPANKNRESWIKWQSDNNKLYVRAGKFFLPYGLRLEDDGAFIRQLSGINFATADNGVEMGVDHKEWSGQLSITNGSAGAAEVDTNKQLSTRLVYIKPTWRLGMSFNINKSETSERNMANVFFAINALSAQWLLEYDTINDKSDNKVTQNILLAEINKTVAQGHNLKLTHEWHDPNANIDNDERTRNSFLWEYMPMQHMQIRTGIRFVEGIPQKPQDNFEELFVNLQSWF